MVYLTWLSSKRGTRKLLVTSQMAPWPLRCCVKGGLCKPCFPRELASRNALQEQKQIKMSLDKPEATAQALTARARLCWRSSSPGLSHWLQTTCCSIFLLSLSTAPAALVFNPEVSLGTHGAMVWDNILSTFQVPKDFITSNRALFPGLAVQLVTIVHKESICVNLKTSEGYVSIGKDESLT